MSPLLKTAALLLLAGNASRTGFEVQTVTTHEAVAVLTAPSAEVDLEAMDACGRVLRVRAIADQEGLACLRWPESARRDRTALVTARLQGRCCVVPVDRQAASWRCAPATLHLWVDRPLYRHGEKVQGRVVVRRHLPDGTGRVVSAPPPADTEVVIEAFTGKAWRLRTRASTDAWGVAAFCWEVPDAAAVGPVEVRCSSGGTEARFEPFVVRAFSRPPLTLDLTCAAVAGTQQATTLRLAARYSTGAAAAGLRARVVARLGRLDDAREFQLDAEGRAEVPLALHEVPPGRRQGRVRVEVELESPDGQVLRETRFVAMQPDAPSPTARAAIRIAGEVARVAVRGDAHERLLVCAVRDRLLAARVVRLDGKGEGVAEFATEASWWPGFEVVTSAGGGALVELQQPALQIACGQAGQSFAPREVVTLQLRTTDAAGAPVPATVAVAVVDESVFALERERLPAPGPSLRPALWAICADAGSAQGSWPRSRWIRELLRRGLLRGWLPGSPAAGGPAFGGPAYATGVAPQPEPDLRHDLRATAAFVAGAVTGADGTGSCTIALPDDVVRWRVTLVAVGFDASAGVRRTQIHTAKPLAITPLLPRVLRAGDELVAKALVQLPDRSLAVRAVPLRAEPADVARGTLRVLVRERSGDATDAVRVDVPVRRPELERPWVVHQEARGDCLLLAPQPERAQRPGTLELLADGDAVLAAASSYLAEYPHGCVEQTTSRLLPYFAAAALRPLTKDERVRVRAGMRRLASLRCGRGFGYWPGAREADPRMTALVLHGLCAARAAGLAPESYGLAIAVAPRVEGLSPTRTAEAELAIAELRWAPASGPHRRAVAGLVRGAEPLPLGMLVRAGLALAAAGERELAQDVLGQALARRGEDAGAGGRAWVGEDRGSRLGMLLDLLLAVAPAHGAKAALVRELERGFDGRSFGTTHATACTVAALLRARAGAAPAALAWPLEVLVAWDRKLELVRLRGPGQRLVLACADPRAVRVQVPPGRSLGVVLRGAEIDRAGGQLGFAAPLLVERTAAAVWADGELQTVEVRVASSLPLQHVVVECPLPAGCALVSEPPGAEVHDDRISFALAEVGASPQVLRFVLRAFVTGTATWPPATAMAMYDETAGGACAESRLTLTAASPRPPSREDAIAPLLPAEFWRRYDGPPYLHFRR